MLLGFVRMTFDPRRPAGHDGPNLDTPSDCRHRDEPMQLHTIEEGAASAVMAVFDGFVLHKGFDPDLSATRIAPLLRRITTAEENGEHR